MAWREYPRTEGIRNFAPGESPLSQDDEPLVLRRTTAARQRPPDLNMLAMNSTPSILGFAANRVHSYSGQSVFWYFQTISKP
jgi:hypothetical protein